MYSASWETHLRATGRHLRYGITVLPATHHKWTRPALTPARQAGTRFTYPGGMEGWVDLGSFYRPDAFPVIIPDTKQMPTSCVKAQKTTACHHTVFMKHEFKKYGICEARVRNWTCLQIWGELQYLKIAEVKQVQPVPSSQDGMFHRAQLVNSTYFI